MVKHQSRPTGMPETDDRDEDRRERRSGGQQQPLSGSKQVKNRNHTRSNHGEGS